MKNIIERLKKGSRLKSLTQTRLALTRFRKLLENVRFIMNLVDDGREKLREEYIFDRHYVTSLLDQVLERAGMMVFDAVVLAPEGGERLYQLHDRLKTFALDHFIKGEGKHASLNQMPDLKPVPEEPELALLFYLLNWITGPMPDGQPSMMVLIRRVTDHIIPALRDGFCPEDARNWIDWSCAGTRHHIQVVDLEEGLFKEGLLSLQDLECRPLGMMFIGAEGENTAKEEQIAQFVKNWVAFTGREKLSLCGTDPDNKLYFEATLSGHTDADFIFLFAEKPLDPQVFLSNAFHLEKTELGALAWLYDVPGHSMEYSLSQVGSNLFGVLRGQGNSI